MLTRETPSMSSNSNNYSSAISPNPSLNYSRDITGRSSNLDDMIEYALSSKRITKSQLQKQGDLAAHNQQAINNQTNYQLISAQGAVLISKSKREKAKRKAKNHRTIEMLEKAYKTRQNWSREDIKGLQRVTGLTKQQIYKWNWDEKRRTSQIPSSSNNKNNNGAFQVAKNQQIATTTERKNLSSLEFSSPDLGSTQQQHFNQRQVISPRVQSAFKAYAQQRESLKEKNLYRNQQGSVSKNFPFIPNSRLTNNLNKSLRKSSHNYFSGRSSAFHSYRHNLQNKGTSINSSMLPPLRMSKLDTQMYQMRSSNQSPRISNVAPYIERDNDVYSHKRTKLNNSFLNKSIDSSMIFNGSKKNFPYNTANIGQYLQNKQTKISSLQSKFNNFQISKRTKKTQNSANFSASSDSSLVQNKFVGHNKRNSKKKSETQLLMRSSFINKKKQQKTNSTAENQSASSSHLTQKKKTQQWKKQRAIFSSTSEEDSSASQNQLLTQRTYSKRNFYQDETNSNPEVIYQNKEEQEQQDQNMKSIFKMKQRSNSYEQLGSKQTENFLDKYLLQNQISAKQIPRIPLFGDNFKSYFEPADVVDYNSTPGGNNITAQQFISKGSIGKASWAGRLESTSSPGYSAFNRYKFRTQSGKNIINDRYSSGKNIIERYSSGSSWGYAFAMRQATKGRGLDDLHDYHKSSGGCQLPDNLSAQAQYDKRQKSEKAKKFFSIINQGDEMNGSLFQSSTFGNK